jgi:uncharacterized protein YoaH (UPF0181 family)
MSESEDSEALQVVHALMAAYFSGGEAKLVAELYRIQQELEMRDWGL